LKPGQSRLTPTHEPALTKPLLDFISDFKPHVCGLMGDMVDCLPVSRHTGRNVIELEGQRLGRDLADLDREFLTPLEERLMPPFKPERLDTYHRAYKSNRCVRIWLDGNHEVWADALVAQNPGLQGLVEPRHVLGLEARNWLVKHQGYLLRMGHWKGAHGDVILGYGGRFSSKYPANRALDVYGSSVRIWHTHMFQVIMRETMANESYHTAVCVPGLCNRAAHYAKNAPNRHAHGFLYGYIFPDGFFDDRVVIIWKNRFMAEGKEYRTKGR
jgi:hypothetical protein